jgi:hypothetical protein
LAITLPAVSPLLGVSHARAQASPRLGWGEYALLKAQRGRQVAKFEAKVAASNHPSQKMREAIDSSQGRELYSQRIATVEPVFANIRHHKGMDRFTLRGKLKVGIQWVLYCLVHNIEKMATKTAYEQ